MAVTRDTCQFLAVVGIALCSLVGCDADKPEVNQELSQKLQALVDSMVDTVGDDPIYNAVLFVESPRIKWKGASGFADGKSEKMTPRHKIKIASIGKTLTAVVILQLMEDGYLTLDDKIDKYLDGPMVRLEHLHMYDGISHGHEITIRQLLSHTSGIADYMEDFRFIPDVLANPHKRYNPALILDKYYDYETEMKAVAPPGERFNYSDVNYVLLATIIERVTGTTLQDQYKSRIFDPLGMENSYLEYYEEPRGEERLSHAYFGSVDLVEDINTSFDWGGGGIVSTCEELVLFFRALLDGGLFNNDSTLTLMLSAADQGIGGTDYDYGLGIMKRSIHGLTFYGHGGAYDCDVYYCPDRNVAVCLSLNQMNTHGKRDELLMRAVELAM